MLKQFFDHLIEFLDHVRIERDKFTVSDAVTVVCDAIRKDLFDRVFNKRRKLIRCQSGVKHCLFYILRDEAEMFPPGSTFVVLEGGWLQRQEERLIRGKIISAATELAV